MVDQNKANAQTAAEAPAKVADAVAETAKKVTSESAKVAKRERAAATRRAKRRETETKSARTAAARRNAKAARTNRNATRKAAATQERIENVFTSPNFFSGFDANSSFVPFQSLFANSGQRGHEHAHRAQKAAEELTNITRENMEAMVEAGRVAAEGVRSLGRDAIARTRDGIEQAADTIRTLAEAKSPTEYLQIQGDFARSSFDRLVADSSRLTESMVKLAGEAFQPLSNRATANAERLNDLVA